MKPKALRVETNPMYPHEAAARLRQIARQLSEVSDDEIEGVRQDLVWTWKLPEHDKVISG